MSQPCDPNCNVPLPGEIDRELGEFWEGNPWSIFRKHNLSSFERNRLFLNAGQRRFIDVSFASATDDDGDGRCSIAADFNGDGRIDLAVRQAGGTPLLVYENSFPQRSYLKVNLRGRQSNRAGIGARLVAHVGDQQIVRECFPANSYRSQGTLTMHFGLGSATVVDRLVIMWPSGQTQEIRNIDADLHVVITEGDDNWNVVIPGEIIPP